MHLIVMGPQGSGKGTQAALLAPALRLHHLSTGELFRAAIASGSPLGQALEIVLNRGDLVTDELTCDLVAERLDGIADGTIRSGSGVIATDAPVAVGALFDGFPRTAPQALAIEDLLSRRGESISAVLEITAPRRELIERLLARGRADDSAEGIERRLEEYQAKTEPILEVYRGRGLVLTIDGARPVDVVHADLLRQLRQRLEEDSAGVGIEA